MTKARRLFAVGALLAVTAIVSSSWTQGEPAAEKKGGPAPRVKAPAKPVDDDAEKALAASKFSLGGAISYEPLKGEPYFALQLQPKVEAAVPVRPRDYLILVGSSAAQAGAPWIAAGQIAEGIIKNANPEDRISLWTLSTPDATRCLTKHFLESKADAKKIQDALTKLRTEHIPAGDTDLKNGLTKAIDDFDGNKSRQRIILYLGDGMSTHDPISPEQRQKMCDDMVKARIVLFSVPLGIKMGPDNLHGFATSTGGAVLRTQILEEKLEDALKRYEKAFAAPVLYATEFSLSSNVSEYFPTRVPPLRGDSPTLIVGRLKDGKKLSYTVKGEVHGVKDLVTVTHKEEVQEPELDNFFLISMVDQWKNAKSQPALVRADRALALAYEQNRLQHQELLLSAEVAVQKNDLEAATKLFEKVKQLAPHAKEADAGIKLVTNLRTGRVTREMIRRHMEKRHHVDRLEKKDGAIRWKKELLEIAQLDKDAPDLKDGAAPPIVGDDLLKAHHDRVVLEEQKMTDTVNVNLRQARADLPVDPDAALELLRGTLLRVRDHPDLSDRVRDALLSRLQAALRDVSSQGATIKLRKREQDAIIEMAKRERSQDEQRRSLEERIEAQYRVFKNLMNLARVEEKAKHEVIYGLEAMAADLRLKGERVPVTLKAAYDQTLASYHLHKNAELKRLREERFLSVMLEVEKSHVPFPDEPGIYFPPLATWDAIRKIRKEKYEVSSLPDDYEGRKEANTIKKLMDEQIEMKDFLAPMNLKEALELFMQKFAGKGKDLPILVDVEAFKEENPDAPSIYDTQIQFQPYPKKMQMATALRLALAKVNPPNATYLIRRNYIEITTIERQTRERVLRVYPVGDLVIPISQQIGGMMGGGQMMGGGGMMGMGGGMMGMMGGGMMGMMGMGGMGMGGMMMGMGGGMMGMAGGMMGMGGMNMGMMGMGGGMMMGGMNMGMMGMGGMNMGMMGMGGMNMGMMGMGGMGMMGGGSMMGGNFTGGSFMGSFSGGLGAVGAILAPSLITTITRVVAPGEWFITQQPQPFNTFLGGGLNNMGGVGPIGGMQLGNIGQPPPLPLPEGGPANIQDANTIDFFPPALALIVRAPSRVHTSFTGGLIGGRPKRPIEPAARIDNGRGLDVIAGGPKNKGGVAGVNDKNPNDKVVIAKGGRRPVENLDASKIWQEELAKGGVNAGLVVATADLLFESGKFDHAAEFLKATLRQGIVVRPWVYEALAVALEASGGDKNEIIRARLSAVALDPQDSQGFLNAARTMAEHKQYDRALAFCRQAAQLEPNLAQPYSEALAYAELGKDSKGMEWAVTNLMSQDWPVDSKTLHLQAETKAESLTEILKQDKRGREADLLKAALQTIRQRDLVIKLTWENGNDAADLDLIVKEPTGSVCSLEQRQTPGGGILIGNTLLETKHATYKAAQAFSGNYEISVRRNWGQTLGNRARVEIIQHLGTPRQTSKLVAVRLDDNTPIKINLTGGRRTTLATVPPPAMQRPREKDEGTNIYTQLRELAHPDFNGARGVRGDAWTPGARPPAEQAALPARKQSERIAYQSGFGQRVGGGANLNAQAVVSADQRFVRLSVTPVFQTVTGSGPLVNLPLIPGGRP